MKTKKFDKKLTLNKRTLTLLENTEMRAVKAGSNPWLENPTTPVPCP